MIERDGNRLRVSGALTLANVAAEAASARQHFSGNVGVDLAAVTEVDSSALSLIFEWQRAARQSDCQISFCNLPASLKSLAELYGVADLIVAADA